MNRPIDSPSTAEADAEELAKFGYDQQLRRSMGWFSSFAISFSLISIITGIFANFTFGFQQIGPAVIWSWCLVAGGQFFVALVLADLSTRIPLAGYGYQWSSRLVGPHFGYWVGWLLLMQFLTGFPGVCHALATTLCSWTLSGEAATHWVPWVSVGIVSVIAIVHLLGIRIVALVNDFGVIAEITAVVLISAALWALHLWHRTTDWNILINDTSPLTGASAGLSAWALSLLMGAWCLTGFEAAADLAEETHQPRRVVPRVVLTAELSSAVFGLLLLAGLVLAFGQVRGAAPGENLVVSILTDSFGAGWMPWVMLVVVVSIFACGVASMAATTRLIFSLARDHMLPASTMLKAVHRRWQTPAGAIAVVWAISVAVILGFGRLEIITSISAAAGYLGYAGIMLASFRARGAGEGFSLGRWQQPIRVIALLWTLGVVAALTVPDTATSADEVSRLPAKSTLAAIVVGGAIYGLIVRRRIVQGVAGPPPVGRSDHPR